MPFRTPSTWIPQLIIGSFPVPMPECSKASEHFIFFPSAFLRAAGKPRSVAGNCGPWLLTSYQAAPWVSDPSSQTFGNLDPICFCNHLGFYLSLRMLDIWRWEKSNLWSADWRNHCRVILALQNEARDRVSQVWHVLILLHAYLVTLWRLRTFWPAYAFVSQCIPCSVQTGR